MFSDGASASCCSALRDVVCFFPLPAALQCSSCVDELLLCFQDLFVVSLPGSWLNLEPRFSFPDAAR